MSFQARYARYAPSGRDQKLLGTPGICTQCTSQHHETIESQKMSEVIRKHKV